MTTQEPEVVERSLKRREFCKVEGISLSFYFKLKALGLAPKEMTVPGSSLVRISPEAVQEYRRKLEAYTESKDGKTEQARRVELSKIAAKEAVKSPGHPSKAGPRKKKR